MEKLLEKAKKYFGDINFSDEILTKKIYRELVRKYHSDVLGNDSEAIRDITSAYADIKRYQLLVKEERKKQTFEKYEFENSLINVKRDIETFMQQLSFIEAEIKVLNSKSKVIKKKLNSNFLYFLFNNKSKKQKFINFSILFIVLEAIFFILLNKFNLSFLTKIIMNTLFNVMAYFIFINQMKCIQSLKNTLTTYSLEKYDLDAQVARLEKRISNLEIKEYTVFQKLQDLKSKQSRCNII